MQAAPRRPEAKRDCMQRQAQHTGHPEADGRIVERIDVGYLDPERQLEHRLEHHSPGRIGGLDRSPRMWAGRGCNAPCLGIEAWWGILALAEATQSFVTPERAGGARHRSRCLSGAHKAGGALEARGLAAHVHEATGCARQADALARVGLDGAGAAPGLLGAARRREVARVLGSGAKVGPVGVCALAARQRRRRALRAVRARHAHVALSSARRVHKLARGALVTLGLLAARLHGTRAARRLLGAARRRKVARLGVRALAGAVEVGGVGRRAGALGAVRAGLAGDARLLALVGLVLAGGAPFTEVSARSGRNIAGGAVPAVGWVGAPRDRVGLPRSARLARRAAIMCAIWVERAGRARRERLPQARRSFCRAETTAWAVAALG
eukprot:scaffold107811_cov66-Phaeocystis_antarctica.AAC.3